MNEKQMVDTTRVSLSSMMDNELKNEDEFAEMVEKISTQKKTGELWRRYHLIRDLLQNISAHREEANKGGAEKCKH